MNPTSASGPETPSPIEWTRGAAASFEARNGGVELVTDASDAGYQAMSQAIALPPNAVPVVRIRGTVHGGRLTVGLLNHARDAWLGFRVYDGGPVDDRLIYDPRGSRSFTVVIATAGGGASRATFDAVDAGVSAREAVFGAAAAAAGGQRGAWLRYPRALLGFVVALATATRDMAGLLFRYRTILATTTRVEFAKRYAGSLLGVFWVFLYPTLLLSIYLFVYLVVFKTSFPGFTQMQYVLYVFSGLVPYIGFMEAVTTGCVSIKQNIHLVKNVILPIELIPVRAVAISMATQLVSTAILLILVAIDRSLTFYLLYLPVVLALQTVFLIGLVWILSALGVVLPDISYSINLLVLFLIFLSPIGFKPDMVPAGFAWMVSWNPLYYLMQMYRECMVYGRWPDLRTAVTFVALCVGSFALGSAFFRRLKGILPDYE